ncbi:pseudouridine synthase [Mucilaginibacter koreensis]
MVFRKPGNSREDKSGRSSNRNQRDGDSFKKSSFNKDNNSPSRFKKSDAGSSDRPARKFGDNAGGKKPFTAGGGRFKSASEGDRPFKKFGSRTDGNRSGERRSSQGEDTRPFRSRNNNNEGGFNKREGGNDRPYSGKPRSTEGRPERGNSRRSDDNSRGSYGDRPSSGRPYNTERSRSIDERPVRTMRSRNKKADEDAAPKSKSSKSDNSLIRLNRYISNAGICSRRKADELIEAGVISVNGEVVSELGFKINPTKDVVKYNNETLKREKMVYVLLNKPKDYITTTDDPQERRTVMQLVDKASKERIYPVGRLDRNTTGLLLMTNDGDLADKLSHPRNNITKLYQVELSKSLTQGDLNKISFGLELEDGLIKPDMISYVAGGSKREVGIQIHSGKNRIVRRIFEHLGYEVVKLDRTIYANLTKKDLPRGRWRYLEEKEIIQLKHLI